MANVGSKIGIKLMNIAIGIPVGIAMKKVVERTWVAARPDHPPRTTSESGVHWADAVGWAALSAAGIVVAELVTRAGAEKAFRALTGSEPPPLKSPGKKAGKKVAKADPVEATA